jgi:hypothetical protein
MWGIPQVFETEARRCPSLVLEAFDKLSVASEFWRKPLDRNIPAEISVPGKVDLAHATFSKPTNDRKLSNAPHHDLFVSLPCLEISGVHRTDRDDKKSPRRKSIEYRGG